MGIILYNMLGGNMLKNSKNRCEFVACNYKPKFNQADMKMDNKFYRLSTPTLLDFFHKYYNSYASICEVKIK